MVLNAAARFTVGLSSFDHISSALYDLHWLPAIYRVRFKLLLLVYKALNNQAPDYIKDFLHKTNKTYRLRSQDHNLLAVPRPKHRTFGDHAFAHSGPFLWNKLNNSEILKGDELWIHGVQVLNLALLRRRTPRFKLMSSFTFFSDWLRLRFWFPFQSFPMGTKKNQKNRS